METSPLQLLDAMEGPTNVTADHTPASGRWSASLDDVQLRHADPGGGPCEMRLVYPMPGGLSMGICEK